MLIGWLGIEDLGLVAIGVIEELGDVAQSVGVNAHSDSFMSVGTNGRWEKEADRFSDREIAQDYLPSVPGLFGSHEWRV